MPQDSTTRPDQGATLIDTLAESRRELLAERKWATDRRDEIGEISSLFARARSRLRHEWVGSAESALVNIEIEIQDRVDVLSIDLRRMDSEIAELSRTVQDEQASCALAGLEGIS